MTLLDHTRAELGHLEPGTILFEYREELLALAEKFVLTGGGETMISAAAIVPLLSNSVKNMLMHLPITPLENLTEDWVDVGDGYLQHSRCSAMFKNGADTCYYLEAIVWVGPNNDTFTSNNVFTTNGAKLRSSQEPIFPFMPRTYYVAVHDENDKWIVDDIKDLEVVRDTYKLVMPGDFEL